mmetsp:Transcript_41272/g.39746  ORF Transcript_41272/g.39746 Transcript_41272/m.39746 type:complete len:110 (+) Transcript_41272:104-433(+)
MLISQIIGLFIYESIPLQIRMTLFLLLNGVMTFLIGLLPIIVPSKMVSYDLELTMLTFMGVLIGFIGISFNGTAGPSSKLMNIYMIGISLINVCIDLIRMLFLAVVPDY